MTIKEIARRAAQSTMSQLASTTPACIEQCAIVAIVRDICDAVASCANVDIAAYDDDERVIPLWRVLERVASRGITGAKVEFSPDIRGHFEVTFTRNDERDFDATYNLYVFGTYTPSSSEHAHFDAHESLEREMDHDARRDHASLRAPYDMEQLELMACEHGGIAW
jgi:hypothetical protein